MFDSTSRDEDIHGSEGKFHKFLTLARTRGGGGGAAHSYAVLPPLPTEYDAMGSPEPVRTLCRREKYHAAAMSQNLILRSFSP